MYIYSLPLQFYTKLVREKIDSYLSQELERENWTTLFRIWTPLVKSIFNDDNYYATSASQYEASNE